MAPEIATPPRNHSYVTPLDSDEVVVHVRLALSPSVRLEVPLTTGVTAFTETHATNHITASPRPPHHFSIPFISNLFSTKKHQARISHLGHLRLKTYFSNVRTPACPNIPFTSPNTHQMLACTNLGHHSMLTTPAQKPLRGMASNHQCNPGHTSLKTNHQPTFTAINAHAQDDMHKH